VAQQGSIRRRTAGDGPEIPDKLYFRIGDVARICEVPAYVLRYWESEFPQLRPNKSGTGQRLYRRRDVEQALRVKRLLYDEGYTISGARQVFKNEQRQGSAAPVPDEPRPVAMESRSDPAAADPGDLSSSGKTLSMAQPGLFGTGPSPEERRKLERLRRDMRDLLMLLVRPAAGAKPKPGLTRLRPVTLGPAPVPVAPRPIRLPIEVEPREPVPRRPLRMREPNRGLLLFGSASANQGVEADATDSLDSTENNPAFSDLDFE
jgi:DNA-binding transcriptional MerR regulator